MKPLAIPALFMRGGTSRGVFFLDSDLPADQSARQAVLLRVIGSPDPYGKQIDGLGGATSSTSKVVVVGPSTRPECDVDFWFGQVSIAESVIDASGNCGNLTAAVGPFSIHRGLVPVTPGGVTTVRIWQANLGKRIVVQVPTDEDGVIEDGDFREDGVAFPAAPIPIEFIDPGEEGGALTTGRPVDRLDLSDGTSIEVSLVSAGNPTVFVRARDVGLDGGETPDRINADAAMLAKLEMIRAHASVAMGLASDVTSATRDRPATPKVSFVSSPADYRSTSGTLITAAEHDVRARIVSMGKLHHAFTGTGAIALAVAAALPGTLVAEASRSGPSSRVRLGHAAGLLAVGAGIGADGRIERVTITRSARLLMRGEVLVPSSTIA